MGFSRMSRSHSRSKSLCRATLAESSAAMEGKPARQARTNSRDRDRRRKSIEPPYLSGAEQSFRQGGEAFRVLFDLEAGVTFREAAGRGGESWFRQQALE